MRIEIIIITIIRSLVLFNFLYLNLKLKILWNLTFFLGDKKLYLFIIYIGLYIDRILFLYPSTSFLTPISISLSLSLSFFPRSDIYLIQTSSQYVRSFDQCLRKVNKCFAYVEEWLLFSALGLMTTQEDDFMAVTKAR